MKRMGKDEIINENLIKMNLEGTSKDEVILELASLLYENGNLATIEDFLEEVKRRESLGTTGIGMGIAIPHGKCSSVIKPAVAFGKSSKDILWDSMDGNPINLVFLLAVPENCASNKHLQLLACLSRKLVHDDFREKLLKTQNEKELLEMLQSVFEEV
ncbi:MAG: PTS transporter subunit EIIA [Thermoanaerobacteraceae bacterium]|nr:PTS transporter subunit EIIA [Thermoanaerobacteraceae bacterium]